MFTYSAFFAEYCVRSEYGLTFPDMFYHEIKCALLNFYKEVFL